MSIFYCRLINSFNHIKKGVLLAFLSVLAAFGAFSQGINTDFGQNRVQYHDFTWQFYQSDNFVTYFYLGGQELGRFAAQLAEQELSSIETILDYKSNSRIEILVYNDISDLNQSNIGVGTDMQNTGGVTKILGNKIFIYYNGDHTDLKRQIREGIAKVLISNMIFGGSIQEVLQNAVLLNLPDWFVDGLVSYIGDPWNAKLDNKLRNGILSGDYKKFNKLSGQDAQFAGHSFWYYVADVYGKESIPNLLYLTRINRSLENGFLFVLGLPYKEAINEWYKYFAKRYEKDENIGNPLSEENIIDKKDFKNRTYYNLKLSPDGKQIAYVTNNMGRYRVHLYDIPTGKGKVLFRGGFKTQTLATDYNYPLLAFDPSGKNLVVLFEKRDVIQLLIYDLTNGDKELKDVLKFQRVVDIAFTNDPRKLVISAINRGQSDIYTYNIQSKTVNQITNDFWDDLQPRYVDLGERKGIVFLSNRNNDTLQITRGIDTILPTDKFDVFFFNENPSKSQVLTNLTNTPNFSEKLPMQIDSSHFAYLSDANGIYNRWAGYIDSTFSHYHRTIYYQDSIVENPIGSWDSLLAVDNSIIDSFSQYPVYKDTAFVFPVTNFNRNIQEQDINPRLGRIADMIYLNGKYNFYDHRVPEVLSKETAPELQNTVYRTKTILQQKLEAIEQLSQPVPKKEKSNPGYFLQNEFRDKDTVYLVDKATEEDKVFRASKVLPYRVKFSTDYVTSQLDNSIIITPYQSFVGNGPVFQQTDLSGLITISLSDLFEDYRFTGGFRLPTSFSGSEYFFSFANNKKRIDKKFLYYRKVDGASYDFTPVHFDPVNAKQKTNYFETSLKYPIDVLRSIRTKFGIRNYKIEFQSTDNFTLNLPNYYENWASAKLEYVFDNTIDLGINIKNGSRYKVYYEIQNQFDLSVDPEVSFDPSLGVMHVIGGDFRHYQKIHRNIIWANRLAGATSFGSRKVIYYLGGVDNWLLPKFNNEIQINMDNNYAFQTLATNMRGFQQNIRNGNNYVVLNSELRIPIFSYLFNTPIRSEIIRNFQIIGFGDIGTAWEGKSPYDQDNPFNSESLKRNNVEIDIRYFRNPVVGGYGLGARTMVLGYFVRADVAWGVDSGIIQDPIWYFSFNLDF